MQMAEALLATDVELPLIARGKVRDIYSAGEGELLFIATDRISAFDHVLGSGVPDKGRILTQISLFWFEFLQEVVANHLITATPARAGFGTRGANDAGASRGDVSGGMRGAGDIFRGRGGRTTRLQGRFVALRCRRGWRESDKLPEPIFTPAAKINTGGHDENISFDVMVTTIGQEHAEALRALTMAIYAKASAYAATKGVILADTKFEFGLVEGQIVLADEVLTPDSSRYWPADRYSPGGPTPSFDKQFVRDYLESIHWNKQAPAPALPQEVVTQTRERYMQAFRLLTGRAEL